MGNDQMEDMDLRHRDVLGLCGRDSGSVDAYTHTHDRGMTDLSRLRRPDYASQESVVE